MAYQIAESEIKTLVKSVAETQGIKNYKISTIETNEKGDGYLGEIYMVTVTDKDSKKQLNLILKFAFRNEEIRQVVPVDDAFSNEINFYSTIYPVLENIRKNSSCEEKFNLLAKCFSVSLKENMEWLVLENLKLQDFRVFNKKLAFDQDHIELIFKRYGYFHALSCALKDQYPEKYSNLIDGEIKDVFIKMFSIAPFCDSTTQMCQLASELLVPGEDDAIIECFKKYTERPIEILNNACEADEKYSLILHGDCWSNNMLFKYDNDSEKPIDIRLIDWQLIRVGSPVCDLSYAMYSGATKSELDNLDNYLKLYYASFSSTLKQLGSDPEILFPFNVLKEQWKVHAKFGLILSILVIRSKCTNAEDIHDFHSEDVFDVSSYMASKFDNVRFNRLIKDLLTHMYEIGAL